MSMHKGQRVLFDGKHCGTIRFLGHVEFARHVWAGVELDEDVGKNNGSVQGKEYFTCKEKHGIFTRKSRIAPLPKLEVGTRVVVKKQHIGVVKFVGQTKFTPGWWIGVDLKRQVGKHDGSVNGVRYFECEDGHGVFVRAVSVSVAQCSFSAAMRKGSFSELPPPQRNGSGSAIATLDTKENNMNGQFSLNGKDSANEEDEDNNTCNNTNTNTSNNNDNDNNNNNNSKQNNRDELKEDDASEEAPSTTMDSIQASNDDSYSKLEEDVTGEKLKKDISESTDDNSNHSDNSTDTIEESPVQPSSEINTLPKPNGIITHDNPEIASLLAELQAEKEKVMKLGLVLMSAKKTITESISTEAHLRWTLEKNIHALEVANSNVVDLSIRNDTLEAEVEDILKEKEELSDRLADCQMELLDAQTEQFNAITECEMMQHELEEVRAKLRSARGSVETFSSIGHGSSYSTAHGSEVGQDHHHLQSSNVIAEADDEDEQQQQRKETEENNEEFEDAEVMSNSNNDNSNEKDDVEDGISKEDDTSKDAADSTREEEEEEEEGVPEANDEDEEDEVFGEEGDNNADDGDVDDDEKLFCTVCEEYGHLAEDCDDTITF